MKNKKQRLGVYVILIIFQIFLQIYLSVKMQGAQAVDDIQVRLQLANILNHQYHWDPYFKWAPQNVGVVLLSSWVIQLFKLFGLHSTALGINLFNLLCIDIAILAGWLILFKGHHFKEADVYFLLVNLFFPLIGLTLILYTDVPATMFCMLTLMLLFLYKQSNKKVRWLYLVLASLSASWAVYLKMNSLILIIAIIIYLLLSTKKIKKLILSLLIFLSVFALSGMSQKSIQQSYNFNVKKGSFPYTYWIALGFNNGTNGTWKPQSSNVPDPWGDTARYATLNKKNKHDIKLIKKETNELKVSGIAYLYAKKINEQWSMGTVGNETKGFSIKSKNSGIYSYIFGANKTFLQSFDQMIYLIILLGFIVEIFRRLRSKHNKATIIDLMAIFIVGIFIFHTTMWEVQQRYAFIAILPMIVLASFGLIKMRELNTYLQKYDGWKVLLKGATILLIFGSVWAIGKTQKNIKINDVVMGQNFINSSYKLKSGAQITENIKVNTNFNNFDINTNGLQTNKKIKFELVNLKNGHTFNLKGGTNSISGVAGSYKLKVKNISHQDITLSVLKSSPLSVLQSPIKGIKKKYLPVSAAQTYYQPLVKGDLLLIFTILFLIILGFEYWERKLIY